MGRRVYLNKMTAGNAAVSWQRQLDAVDWKVSGDEMVETSAAIGRVTSRAVFACENAPSFASCAMDGIAVHAEDTFGACDTSPKTLDPGSFREVNTGNPLPDGFDAVIKVEELNPTSEGGVTIYRAATPWQHVRQIGENAVRGAMLLPSAHYIDPASAALLLSAHVLTVNVKSRPRVAIIPTGDELTPASSPVQGKVPEYNSTLIAGSLAQWGAETTVYPITADDRDTIGEVLLSAVDTHDIVLLNAGSSAGTRDFAADVVQDLGSLVVHGVELRPGKPLLLGMVRGKPVAGLPGYPVAALVDLEWFVKPLVLRESGLRLPSPTRVEATAATTITSNLGSQEVVRGRLADVAGELLFHPLPRGSASLTSAVRADGVTVLPSGSEGVSEGAPVEVDLCGVGRDLSRSIIGVGSHDLLLDVLADNLARLRPPISMDSIHVGSMGGLRAMARRRAHLAGIHLLDGQTGLYNDPFLDKYLAKTPHALVHLCRRTQGLMVQPGNPKKVGELSDIARKDVRFVNRQQGSGTRVLLDIKLTHLGLSPEEVEGYDREETTHIAVAVRVANGFADCGLGILAAAQALGLDFVPIEEERYDLVVNADFFASEVFPTLLGIIESSEFRSAAEALGGYCLAESGRLLRQPSH